MKSKLKISFVAPFGLLAKGTTAARVLPIAEALAARGHAVRVIVPPWDDPAGSADLTLRTARWEGVNGVERVFVPVGGELQPLRIPYRLAREVLTDGPDIIHVFKPKAFSGLAALLLAGWGRRFMLDTDDWEGPGGYNDVNPYSALQKRLFAWQERDLPGRAVGVTVASRTLETQAWGFGVKPERVLYLPNGVSAQKYDDWNRDRTEEATQVWRQKLGFTEDNLIWLAYTRFAEFKPERLLEITRMALTYLPPDRAERVRLLVVGGGFRGEEKTFMDQAALFGLADKTTLTGAVALADLPALLRLGDVALYPFDDNLINRARCSAKFLDLLMAERAVVTEAVGELPNYLKHGEGGLIVPPGDLVAFAQAVVQLSNLTTDERTALGRQGLYRLETKFSWSHLLTPLEDFYHTIRHPS